MPKSMTIGEFINECYAYPYSRTYFELYKEGLEFDLVAQYLESMDAAEDYEMVESGAVSDPNYFCPYDESVEEKYASYFQEKDTGDGRGESWNKDIPFFPRVLNWIKVTALRFWDAIVSLFKKVEKKEQTEEQAQEEEQQAVEQVNEAQAAPAASSDSSPSAPAPARRAGRRITSIKDAVWTKDSIQRVFTGAKTKADYWVFSPFKGKLSPRDFKFTPGLSDVEKKAIIHYTSFVLETSSITILLKDKSSISKFLLSNSDATSRSYDLDKVASYEDIGSCFDSISGRKNIADIAKMEKELLAARNKAMAQGITIGVGQQTVSDAITKIRNVRSKLDETFSKWLSADSTYSFHKDSLNKNVLDNMKDYVWDSKPVDLGDGKPHTIKTRTDKLTAAGEEKRKRRNESLEVTSRMGGIVTKISKMISETCGSSLVIYLVLCSNIVRFRGAGSISKLYAAAFGVK